MLLYRRAEEAGTVHRVSARGEDRAVETAATSDVQHASVMKIDHMA